MIRGAPERRLFGTEKPGVGSAIDPRTGAYLDDLKPAIDGIAWLTDEQHKAIFEGNATAEEAWQITAIRDALDACGGVRQRSPHTRR